MAATVVGLLAYFVVITVAMTIRVAVVDVTAITIAIEAVAELAN